MAATTVSQHIEQLGTVAIGTQTYTAEAVTNRWNDGGEDHQRTTVQLTGARGGSYFLRPLLNRDRTESGVFQVISWKGGRELRVKGNEVRVVMVGDVIEMYRGR